MDKDYFNSLKNSVQDSFKVNLDSNADKSKVTLELFNLNGAKVKTFKHADSYDISSLPKGVYILEINNGTSKVVKKLVKK